MDNFSSVQIKTIMLRVRDREQMLTFWRIKYRYEWVLKIALFDGFDVLPFFSCRV
jgi:hypothetical protein